MPVMTNNAFGDPLSFLQIQSGKVVTPQRETGADGSSNLDTPQRAIKLGEPVPIVFALRRNNKGGILISPGATEARFTNSSSNAVTAYYHLVLSEGQIDGIPRKHVFQRVCRRGDHSKTYNRRAGTWTPGNEIIQRAGYDKPECSNYCGSVGTYPKMSTMSYEVTIPNGFDQWNRQVHVFIQGGMHVTRLTDSVVGPSDNFADLVRWMLQNTKRVPAAIIDNSALATAASFLEANGFTCNCYITESINYSDLLVNWAPYFLLCESNKNGKKGLRPLLPINANGTINTSAIVPKYTFTEDTVIDGTLEIEYASYSDRQPFVAQMTWRQELEYDFAIMRTAEVEYKNKSPEGPYESHDLSAFCTSENHAVKVGAYILAKRVYTTHSIRFSAIPQSHDKIVETGDIIRVKLKREALGFTPINHDYLYQVERITKTLNGDVSYECTHFPVDGQGRSLISLDVAAAVGSGVNFVGNSTGVSCDVNSSTDNTIPSEQYTATQPIPGTEPVALDQFQASLGNSTSGSGGGSSGSGGSGGSGSGGGIGGGPYNPPIENPNDNLDPPASVPFAIVSGLPKRGAALVGRNPCPNGQTASVRWFYADRPGGSYSEFNNFGSQVYVVGSLFIQAQGKAAVRAIWYCGNIPTVSYETEITSDSPDQYNTYICKDPFNSSQELSSYGYPVKIEEVNNNGTVQWIAHRYIEQGGVPSQVFVGSTTLGALSAPVLRIIPPGKPAVII